MENYEWAKEMNCAVTVCDAEGIIIYQNDKAVETYKKHGNLIERISMSVTRRGRKRLSAICSPPAAATPIPLRNRAFTK